MHQGLDDLIGPLRPRLLRFAVKLTGCRDEADDLVQTACEKALRAEGPRHSGGRVDSWMFRIIQNSWIDQRRAAARAGAQVPMAEVPEGELAADALAGIEAGCTLAKVRRSMADLPPDQRAVLERVAFGGLTCRECAAELGLPLGTVMGRLARARAALSRRLETPARPTVSGTPPSSRR